MTQTSYYLKRVGQAALTLWATVTLSFFMIRLMPGGPFQALRIQLLQETGEMPTEAEVARWAEVYYGINPADDPLYVQYVDYLVSVAQGDFGQSIFMSEPVWDVLAPAMPWTFWLFSTALLLNFFVGVAIGAVMAWYEGSNLDYGATVSGVLMNSTPYYAFALMLLYLMGYQWGMFPTGGRYASSVDPGFSVEFVLSVLNHGALPLISLVLAGWAGRAIAMRGNSIRVLGKEYLYVAQLRGLSDSRIATRYVMRNAILPMYTGLMISIASVFGGSVIMEEIYRYPGMGYYLFNATTNRDYPLMMASMIMFTVITVFGILIADLTYGKIDPRAGGEGREAF